MILNFFDVAHPTKVYPLSFRWAMPKPPVSHYDVFDCTPTLTLKSSITIVYNTGFCFFMMFQLCCRICLSLHLSEMPLIERSLAYQVPPIMAWEVEAALRKMKNEWERSVKRSS